MQVVNELTGEMVDIHYKTNEDIKNSWRLAQSYEVMAKKIRDQLKPIVQDKVDSGEGVFTDDYKFTVTYVQRKTYDKITLKECFLDEDLIDTFLIPDKGMIDKYVKEHLAELGDRSHVLRYNMVDVGKPYQIIKLEKLKRD